MTGDWPEGKAIVYCQGAFGTTNGKTAHGLVRRSERYRVLSVIDSNAAGRDAGELLDGKPCGIPILGDLEAARAAAAAAGAEATHFVVGLAPDGGRLPASGRAAVEEALRGGLDVVCGLHDFLSEDPGLAALAAEHGAALIDVRKPPPRNELHFFTGKIEQVDSLKLAVLGTDSAVGKRTTAWLLVDELRRRGRSAELVGTGQTAWLQGARYSIVLDSVVSDFVTGEIEHATWSAWHAERPETIVLEGQGSLLNPAYPGGFELLAAGRPEAVILQHAPARLEYDGFPGFKIHPLARQIEAIEIISDRPVVAVTLNHEGLDADATRAAAEAITAETGLPACDVLRDGPEALAAIVEQLADRHRQGRP